MSRQAEVQDHDTAVASTHHIGGLEIPVHQAGLVRCGQASCRGQCNRGRWIMTEYYDPPGWWNEENEKRNNGIVQQWNSSPVTPPG